MLGILGGTFDPVHLGHTHIARQVLTRLDLEQLQFMPCATPVHRDAPRASAEQRCAMIELALRGAPKLVLNRLELEREEPSYTIDSLYRLRCDYSGPVALILGGDAFNGFAGWKAPDEILELAHLVVCCRPGFTADAGLFAGRRVDGAEQLRRRQGGGILLLEVDAPDCSASQVRAALSAGVSTEGLLDRAVACYIEQHKLYRKIRD